MDFLSLKKHRIELKLPLLIIEGRNGLLACGYLNGETFNKTDEACAIVTGVKNFDEMLDARIVFMSKAARLLGAKDGMLGRDFLDIIK